MGKHYTDYERYEHCRKYRLSGMSVAEYARVNGINRSKLLIIQKSVGMIYSPSLMMDI